MTPEQNQIAIMVFVGIFVLTAWGAYYLGWSSAKRQFEGPPGAAWAFPTDSPNKVYLSPAPSITPDPQPDPEPEDDPEPLIFGKHHFIQYSPYGDDDVELWLVQRLTLHRGFWVETKEQAIELMAKADAYMELR